MQMTTDKIHEHGNITVLTSHFKFQGEVMILFTDLFQHMEGEHHHYNMVEEHHHLY